MRVQPIVALAAMLCLAACGTPGAPRPPSLELPKPVTDLSATRVGNRVTLKWTVPVETTDGTNIRHPGPTRICRDLVQPKPESCTVVAEVPPAAAPGTTRNPVTSTYVDQLPPSFATDHPTGFAQYAVVALNQRGKSAGDSNQVQVPLTPTLPPPSDIQSRVGPDSVEISATVEPVNIVFPPGLSVEYRLLRRLADSDAEVELGVEATRATTKGGASSASTLLFVDRSFEWEKKYVYRVRANTVAAFGAKNYYVQGEPSKSVEVFTHDVFPPAAPTGLQAVASGVGQAPFIDLSWAANTEADLAGYNVYRHEEGQPAVKINTELVKAPAFRDPGAASGHKYLYAVTAVDLRGNESSHSAEASESVP